MLDIKFIRDNIEIVRKALKDRRNNFDLDGFLELDSERRRLIQELDELRCLKNNENQNIQAMLRDNMDISGKRTSMKELSGKISSLEENYKKVKKEFDNKILRIPNVPDGSIPVGGEDENKIIKEWGKKRDFDFRARSHIELAEALGIIKFDTAAKITGSNFVMFQGQGAKLERALIQFMLDLHADEHGYKEISPPFIVNRDSMTATGQLPKLEEDMYRTSAEDLFLIPTAEVPVTNIYRDEIIEEKNLPVYYVAYTPCFRREAGSYGKETRGLMRVHQFDKVELVKFVVPEDSRDELEKLLNNACKVLELLEIPYRVVLLATGEISFSAAKCYDIEIYAPGIDKWLEVSSCSNFEDFQARRGNMRYRQERTKKLRFPHTLNGSGVALARLLACLLEQYQNPDMTITVPEVLVKYMNGKTIIKN